jgi:hypothetical protein
MNISASRKIDRRNDQRGNAQQKEGAKGRKRKTPSNRNGYGIPWIAIDDKLQ